MGIVGSVFLYLLSAEAISDRSKEKRFLISKGLSMIMSGVQQFGILFVLSNLYFLRKQLLRSWSLHKGFVTILLSLSLVNWFTIVYRQFTSRAVFLRELRKLSSIPSGKLSNMQLDLQKLYLCASPLPHTALELHVRNYISHSDNTILNMKNVYYTKERNQRQAMDLYFTKKCNSSMKTRKVILWLHGGAWVAGSKSMVHPLFVDLAKEGWIVAAANYRLINGNGDIEITDQIMDIKRCIAWIKSNLPNLLRSKLHRFESECVDLCIGGTSAGAHLSLCCALTQNELKWQPRSEDYSTTDTKLCACIDFFGPKDLTDGKFYTKNQNDQQKEAKNYAAMYHNINSFLKMRILNGSFKSKKSVDLCEVSPLQLLKKRNVKEILPPCPIFGIHGQFDSLVSINESTEFYAVLKDFRTKAKVESNDVLVQVEAAPHGLHLFNSPWSRFSSDSILLWLKHCT